MIKRLDPRMVTALAGVASFGVLFTMGAAIFADGASALSVALGAAIAAANLFVLAQIVASMVEASVPVEAPEAAAEGAPPPPRSNAGVWGVFAVVKMLVLFGGIWLLMTKGLVAPIPMVVGYGSLPIGIAIGSLVSDKATPKSPQR